MTWSILQRWSEGNSATKEELETLLELELSTPERSIAFGLTTDNCPSKIAERKEVFCHICTEVLQLCQNFGFQDSHYILTTLWNLWLPLGMQLASEKEKLGRTLIQGILGGQGTGKTTLAAVIRLILQHLGYSSVAISIDDLYKTYPERQQLQQLDSRLIWRGPPGTHDVKLAIEVLDCLRQENRQEPILIPRFDKSAFNGAGDRDTPESIDPVDLVLFEGWFIGARPIDEQTFVSAPSPIDTEADQSFAKDNNDRLRDYLSIWERLDRLIVLYPVNYHCCKEWRKEAEHKMIAQGKTGMCDEEIDKFVEFFWRSLHPELFITPLTTNPHFTDMVIEINPDHSPGKVYKPK